MASQNIIETDTPREFMIKDEEINHQLSLITSDVILQFQETLMMRMDEIEAMVSKFYEILLKKKKKQATLTNIPPLNKTTDIQSFGKLNESNQQ